MTTSYAGVGSRETPQDIADEMSKIAYRLAKAGALLRSGGADGADAAFEKGCIDANGKMEIYLPWNNFNGRIVDQRNYFLANSAVDSMAADLVNRFHPAPEKLIQSTARLHKRNCHQVLGWNLDDPVKFLIFYGVNVKYNNRMLAYDCDGGTKTAVRIASSMGIPCYNLGNPNVLSYLKVKLKLD